MDVLPSCRMAWQLSRLGLGSTSCHAKQMLHTTNQSVLLLSVNTCVTSRTGRPGRVVCLVAGLLGRSPLCKGLSSCQTEQKLQTADQSMLAAVIKCIHPQLEPSPSRAGQMLHTACLGHNNTCITCILLDKRARLHLLPGCSMACNCSLCLAQRVNVLHQGKLNRLSLMKHTHMWH